MVNDMCTYRIHLRGQVSEQEINALSPLQTTVENAGADSMLVSLCTDQSGLVGLLRHLHGLGFVFLSILRTDERSEKDE